MSGLSKQKRIFKKQTITIVMVYLFLCICISLALSNLTTINDVLMERQVKKIKNNVESIIVSNDSLISNLEQVTQDNLMKLIVRENNEVLYSNTAINDIEILNASIEPELVYYSSSYEVISNSQKYQVWLIIYNIPTSELLKTIILTFMIAFILVSIVVSGIILLSSKMLLRPLDKLGSNLQKLRTFKFDGIMSTDDKIELFTEELKEFASDIKTKTEEFGIAYTSLEKELLTKHEESSYKKQIVSSLVHDLKTPINIIKLQSTDLDDHVGKIQQTDLAQIAKEQLQIERSKRALHDINDNADVILSEVKEILQVVNQDYTKTYIDKFDLVVEIKNSVNLFGKLFADKGLSTDLVLLRTAFVEASKVELQSVINNALANIYNYAKTDTEVVISLDEKDGFYILDFINEAERIDEIDFGNAFNLFQVNGSASSEDSTGVGLFVVNKFVEKNKGNCTFCLNEDNRVVLQIILPKLGDNYEEQ